MPRQEIPAGLIHSMCSHWSSGIKISAWTVKCSLSSEMWLSRGGERGGILWDQHLEALPWEWGHVDQLWGDSRVSPRAGMAVGVPWESLWELSWALFSTAWSEKSGNIKECWCIPLRSSLGDSGLMAVWEYPSRRGIFRERGSPGKAGEQGKESGNPWRYSKFNWT